jgi:hypothetical protein
MPQLEDELYVNSVHEMRVFIRKLRDHEYVDGIPTSVLEKVKIRLDRILYEEFYVSDTIWLPSVITEEDTGSHAEVVYRRMVRRPDGSLSTITVNLRAHTDYFAVTIEAYHTEFEHAKVRSNRFVDVTTQISPASRARMRRVMRGAPVQPNDDPVSILDRSSAQ